MQQVELSDLEAKLQSLIERALHGEDVIITESDQPILKMVRIAQNAQRRKRGSAKGQIKIADDFDAPLDDFQAYMP